LTSALRKSSTSSVSSVTSVSTGGDTQSPLHRPPRVQRSYSQAAGGSRRTANPMLADASLPYQHDPPVDMSTEDFDMMASLGTAAEGGTLSVDDKMLISQFEQFFNSQSSSSLSELESLLCGDSLTTDLTSSLFTAAGDQDVGGSQAPSAVESHLVKTERQPSRPMAAQRGAGLLGQLLDDGGSACTSGHSELSTSETLPQRPCSLAVSSAYSIQRGMYPPHIHAHAYY